MFRHGVERELVEDGSGPSSLNLTGLSDGESATVVGFSGEASMAGKLQSMGILPGSVIEKKSSALRRGPIVVGRGGTELALAYSIAQRILVEPLR
jgi:Fe2+ transport system protein FeoA